MVYNSVKFHTGKRSRNVSYAASTESKWPHLFANRNTYNGKPRGVKLAQPHLP